MSLHGLLSYYFLPESYWSTQLGVAVFLVDIFHV